MKRRIVFWGILTVFCAVLAAGAQAKETEMYFNDFSDAASLSDFSSIKGNWNIQNGTLSTGSGTGSAYLTYTIPVEYAGKDFRAEVDFLGHTSTGGLLIGGIGAVSGQPKEFFGYDFFGQRGCAERRDGML